MNRKHFCCALAVLVLAGCAGYGPPAERAMIPRDDAGYRESTSLLQRDSAFQHAVLLVDQRATHYQVDGS